LVGGHLLAVELGDAVVAPQSHFLGR
jgi:hypothetical protein